MLNVLIPLAGSSPFFEGPEYLYPKPLIEVNGKPMIQHVIENLETIRQEKRFLFIVKLEDCQKYHLDSSLRLLTDDNCQVIKLERDTRGAACSALMAIEHIDNDEPLLIVNGDQIIERDLDRVVTHFREEDADVGVVCFPSVHPKWSFVRLDENGRIVETAEKRPLSRHAIAGFYYFKSGSDFVRAAMRSIENDTHVNGLYFIAPTINQLVLERRNMMVYHVADHEYHNFYSPQKIQEYERGHYIGRHEVEAPGLIG